MHHRKIRLTQVTGALLLFAAIAALATAVGTASGNEPSPGQQNGVADEDTARVRELPGRRTATSTTFLLENDSLETQLFEVPVNYRDEDGDWRPIEEELEETSSGSITNGDNSFDLQLPDDLNEGPVEVVLGDEVWVSERLVDIEIGSSDLKGETAVTYPAAGGSATFEFASLNNGLKESISLADLSAPSTYRFELDAAPGLVPTIKDDGSIAFRDDDNQAVVEMPAPFMNDAAGQMAPPEAVVYELEGIEDGGWMLAVDADREWLQEPDRSWPVTIDPSTTLPKPSDDCIIATTTENMMCGTSGNGYLTAKANYTSTEKQLARTLVQFALPGSLAKASATSAALKLYAAKAATNVTQVDLYDIGSSGLVELANSSWKFKNYWRYNTSNQGEGLWQKTGGDYGKFMPNPASVKPSDRGGSGPGWWTFSSLDLAQLVNRWIDHSRPNQGVLLKLADEDTVISGIERRVEWESSAGTNKPYLSVQFIEPASFDSKITAPSDGTKTAKRFLLTSAWEHPGVTDVTFQYRTDKGWTDIPGNQVIDQENQAVTWPYSVPKLGDRESRPLYWDASSITGGLREKKVEIRAVLSGDPGAGGYTKAVSAEINKHFGGPKDAGTGVGPGSVDLMTGNFTISRTDLSIAAFNSALEFSRSFSSRDTGAEANGVLGPGWKPASPVEEAGGSSWSKLVVKEEAEVEEEGTTTFKWAELTHSEGGVLAFEEEGGKFITPPEMSGYVLYRNTTTGNIELTDPAGNRTVFSNNGSSNEYLPISVAMTGGPGNKSRMIYELVASNRRLKKIIAPAAPGISCPDEGSSIVDGCRLLVFNYGTINSTGNPTRLLSITYYGPGEGQWDVAGYSYNSEGRLAAAWDPRITPNLKETYTYNATGQIATLTPPGQEPWTMSYGTLPGGTAVGRLTSVKRATLVESKPTAQTTIAYEVPVSGTGAPYGMGGAAVAEWGQEDLPTDATAIFPPDEVPAGPPSSYTRATVYYMDAEGQLVNVATPAGAGTSAPSITTTETDRFGNVVRELGAQNRLRAMAQGTPKAREGKSRELDTQFRYSKDGTELQEEIGPMHQVRLESGTTTQARLHRSILYDANFKYLNGTTTPSAGETEPHVPTSETTGALLSNETVVDKRSTKYVYNWMLRKQTEVIADPEGSEETKSVTVYDSTTGLPAETRQPKNASGGGAGTTKIIYYKAGSSSANCEQSSFAGLPCKTEPAAQPGTVGQPQLLVKQVTAYNQLGEPLEVTESAGSAGGTVRKKVSTYDAAGRIRSSKITGGGTSIPRAETLYDPLQGLPTTQRFACESECGVAAKSSAFGSAEPGMGELKRPMDVALDADGNSWVIDREQGRLLKYDASGKFITQYGSPGSGNGQFSAPSGIEITPNGHIWVADGGNGRIQELDGNGGFLNAYKFSTGADPFDIASGPGGVLWVSDRGLHRVVQLRDNGGSVTALGLATGSQSAPDGTATDLSAPTGITSDPSGNVWVVDNGTSKVLEFDANGKFVRQFGTTGSGNGQLSNPVGIGATSSGNLLVVDGGNNRVEEFSTTGTYVGQFGGGQLLEPRGFVVGPANSVLIADAGNKRIQKWTLPFDNQATQVTYDELGRPAAFEDADGNKASTTYDYLGRPIAVDDGKGTQTLRYDSTTGFLVELEDSAAGIFTASYDADGQIVKQGLPNGMTREMSVDEAGEPVGLTYTKASNCGTSCTWLSSAVQRSIRGQILVEDGTLGKEEYGYDKMGRLTTARETLTGGNCTTRTYAYDKDSNRTGMTTIPGVAGACSSSGGTARSYSYDGADRLLGPTYDDFGRITSLPGEFVGGKTVTTSYFSNDMVATQSQDGVTNSFELDAMLRHRQRLQAGGLQGTEIFHYSGPSDSPAWTERGTTWTRNISGIGGEMAALQESGKEIELQLINMHGDLVATAALSPTATSLKAVFTFDEFGNQTSGTTGRRFGWLGGKQRRTELKSGVVQMGVRSYLPMVGRFISRDPVGGGSANAYDYANADPINGFDLSGEAPCTPQDQKQRPHRGIAGQYRITVSARVKCSRKGPRNVRVKAVITGGYYEPAAGVIKGIPGAKGPLEECGDAVPKFACPVEASTSFEAVPACGEVWPGEVEVLFQISWETPKGRRKTHTFQDFFSFTFGTSCG